jgi:NAD-dependent deacetylase
MTASSSSLEKAAQHLKNAKNILFITGAGLSADSGLPTYRGVGGLYEDTPTEEGIPIEMALAGETLATRPEITWKYLSQIEKNCRKATFNQGHSVIALMEKRFPRVWTITQNIDGFHTMAGAKNVIEIHGNMRRLRCDACGWRKEIRDFTEIQIPPQCGQCSYRARPDVVFFGENLPYEECVIYEQQLRQGFDVYLWIGTTSAFPYIQRPLVEARRFGGVTIEINPGETEISNTVDIKIPLRAAEALEKIWNSFQR